MNFEHVRRKFNLIHNCNMDSGASQAKFCSKDHFKVSRKLAFRFLDLIFAYIYKYIYVRVKLTGN